MAADWRSDLEKLKVGAKPAAVSSPEKWREDLETLKASSPKLYQELQSAATDLTTAEAELEVLKNNDLSPKKDNSVGAEDSKEARETEPTEERGGSK